MPSRKPVSPPVAEAAAEDTPEAQMPREAPPSPPRAPRLVGLLRKPLVLFPLLVLAGVLCGYILGLLRLSAGKRQWDAQRVELLQTTEQLQSALREARGQETSYRILVLISRAVVALYDRNYGLAAEDLREVRQIVKAAPQGSELEPRLEALQAELDELSRRVDEMTQSARDTMRGIEREVTTLFFPHEP